MTHRNRAEGWQHAKLTGHENEKNLILLVKNDILIQKRILNVANYPNAKIANIYIGGLNEKNVVSVLGDTTKSKTDMYIQLDNNKLINISIKKDTGGQVYLISAERFIDGFEIQYKKVISHNVKRAISLFWGSSNDTIDIINQYGTNNKAYELKKHRLVAETLKAYNNNLALILLDWFNENIVDIFNYCFSRGLAKNHDDWANILWYKNTLAENNLDYLFNLDHIGSLLKKNATYGTKTGGSTIQLPFGFVQWHSPTKKIPGNMQFHHSYKKIILIK